MSNIKHHEGKSMPNLYAGNILKVDLSSGEITKERTSVYADAFLGGRGINIKLLYDNISRGTDALASGNVLVFGVGPLGGTSLSTGRTEVTAKSPETGLLASANFGGSFGGELKYAGYDHLVLTGKAENPVYILINNDTVEIRDASGVWGKDAYETQDHLRGEAGNPEVKIACIGPAGENLVRFATIQHGLGHATGRTGTGAVMGSKNLKAIVVRGTGGLKIADPVKFLAHAGELKSAIGEHPGLKAFSEEGMSRVQDPDPEEAKERWGKPMPSEPAIYDKFKPKRTGCLGCPVQCMDLYQAKELGKGGSGVISCHLYSEWTKNVMCFDSAVSLECAVLSQRFGIDCISSALTIRWLMELYEIGIITAKDTDGIVMEWGSPQAMRSMLDKITFREGIGDVLADGIINISDVVLLVSIILDEVIPTEQMVEAGDINEDGILDIVDIIAIIEVILSREVHESSPITNVEIKNVNNQIFVESDGDIAGLQIEFIGEFILLSSELSNDWNISYNDNLILIYNTKNSTLPKGQLLSFEGGMEINEVIAIDWYQNVITADIENLPSTTTLLASYPNPFNPSVNIHYTLSEESLVSVDVYNITGQKVAELFNDVQSQGYHQTSWTANEFASGMYIVKLTTNSFTSSQKVLLMK